jgi:cyanophycinase
LLSLLLACRPPSGPARGAADASAPADDTAEGEDSAAPPLEPPDDLVLWWSGDPADAVVEVSGPAALLIGGGLEPDDAVVEWLGRAAGGDVVVLRTSGSDGYNPYLYEDIGGVDSVLTLLLDDRAHADDPWVASELAGAEAIWLAGGDQWTYHQAWGGTATAAALDAAWGRGAVLAGTSAGLAVMGDPGFTAERTSVTSAEALADPCGPDVTLADPLAAVPPLAGVVTDTHFAERDRQGRLVAFMAKAWTQGGGPRVGLGVDEGTGVLVGGDGVATVFGPGEAWWFAADAPPDVCAAGSPLTWNGLRVVRLSAGGTTTLPAGPAGGAPLSVDAGNISGL